MIKNMWISLIILRKIMNSKRIKERNITQINSGEFYNNKTKQKNRENLIYYKNNHNLRWKKRREIYIRKGIKRLNNLLIKVLEDNIESSINNIKTPTKKALLTKNPSNQLL